MRKIKSIFVEGIGWADSEKGEIELFQKNGEMALVDWYRQGNVEYNGKYVSVVVYKEE